MRISYNWLKNYIDINLPPEKLAGIFTMAGIGVESVEKTADDSIFELEITANRPDWLSVVGVARELSAITGKKLKVPVVTHSTHNAVPACQQAGRRSTISIKIEDKKLCPRYTARIIKNVRVGDSPAWLKARLEAMGLRSVNNIVDITNFCLFETGEPMHAFDLGKIKGAEIIIRRAKDKEKITTIDGAEKVLSASDLVIADSERPVAIAGVMGGLNTEVNYSTKDILLEAANFNPISIRRTARALGISTESSYRFERRVDPENVYYSSDRAALLIKELCGGDIGEFIDLGDKKIPSRTVNLRYEKLNKVLGMNINASAAKKILNSLGLKLKSSSSKKISLAIPGFRNDLNNEIDLIEEVSRIYGYDKIPLTIPAISEQAETVSFEMAASGKIRSSLIGLGVDEIMTYSLVGKSALESAMIDTDKATRIKNPLTSEQELMRPSLIIGMLNSILWNINRKTKNLKLFELGNIYIKESDDKFTEKKHLSIGITGDIYANWADRARQCSFFDLKGIVETLLFQMGIEGASYKYSKDNLFVAGECASIELNGSALGIIGRVSAGVLNNFDIKERVYIAELDADAVIKYAALEKSFTGIPKYPSVSRDISIIAGKDISNSEILNLIKAAGGMALKDVRLIDRYTGEQIPDGKVSLTYALEYQDPKKTLEEKEVSDAQARILASLAEKLGAKLR